MQENSAHELSLIRSKRIFRLFAKIPLNDFVFIFALIWLVSLAHVWANTASVNKPFRNIPCAPSVNTRDTPHSVDHVETSWFPPRENSKKR